MDINEEQLVITKFAQVVSDQFGSLKGDSGEEKITTDLVDMVNLALGKEGWAVEKKVLKEGQTWGKAVLEVAAKSDLKKTCLTTFLPTHMVERRAGYDLAWLVQPPNNKGAFVAFLQAKKLKENTVDFTYTSANIKNSDLGNEQTAMVLDTLDLHMEALSDKIVVGGGYIIYDQPHSLLYFVPAVDVLFLGDKKNREVTKESVTGTDKDLFTKSFNWGNLVNNQLRLTAVANKGERELVKDKQKEEKRLEKGKQEKATIGRNDEKQARKDEVLMQKEDLGGRKGERKDENEDDGKYSPGDEKKKKVKEGV